MFLSELRLPPPLLRKLHQMSEADANHADRAEVHADTPVGREEDLLGRRPFAQLIARQIRLNRPTEGLVTAVVGDWGSGKTSVLRMVAEELNDAPHGGSSSATNDLVVVEFNPWLFSGSEQLTALFFVSLSEQLPDKLGAERAGNVADRLRGYGTALGTLRSLPGIGGLFGAGAELAEEAAKRLDPRTVDLPTQRQALAEALRELDTHIVVVVDDVDRLQTKGEIRDLMRMVKLVGDLPGVTYVLSYDRRPVAAALSSKSISGHEYLEKIVQVEHRLPEPARERLMAMLDHELNAALAHLPQDRLDRDRWSEVWAMIIQPLITTPRHVRRYSNALRLTLDLHHEEVDLVDQLALTAIGTFLPSLHSRLPALADVLLSSAAFLSALFPEDEREAAKARLEQAASDCGNREVALAFYDLLFPGTSRILRGSEIGRFNPREAQRRRRVADPQAFWRYVTAAIPEEALTVAQVNAVLEAIADEDRLLGELRDRDLDELGRLFDRLRALTGDIDQASIPSAARVITAHVRERTQTRVETVDDPRRQIVWFVAELVSELPDDTRHSFLTAWAREEPSPEGKLAVYEISRYKTDRGDVLIGDENLADLEGQLATVVRTTDPEDLLQLVAAGRLLYLTGQHLAERDVSALHALLDDDRVFVRYLSVFTEPSFGDGPAPLAWGALTGSLGGEWLIERVSRVDRGLELTGEFAEALESARQRAAPEE